MGAEGRLESTVLVVRRNAPPLIRTVHVFPYILPRWAPSAGLPAPHSSFPPCPHSTPHCMFTPPSQVGTVSEAYPHLIFDQLSSKLGER